MYFSKFGAQHSSCFPHGSVHLRGLSTGKIGSMKQESGLWQAGDANTLKYTVHTYICLYGVILGAGWLQYRVRAHAL